MRNLTQLAPLLMLLATLAACRSQKAVQKDEALAVDSLASTAQHRTIASLDSAFARLSLDFDTLDITIERVAPALPATDTAALPRKETLKLRAVKGKLTDTRARHHQIAEQHQRRDTLAYHLAAADRSAEHTATTRLYDPPSTTGILILLIITLGATLCIFIHRRK